MKRLNICIIDLVFIAPNHALYQRLMYGNYMSIMPQVIGVWCRQEGHAVSYILYGGFNNILKEIPEKTDVVFISAFTFTAQLAYAVSNFLRSRGIVTILGGPHARCYPEDACRYFDFVLGMTDRILLVDVLHGICQNRSTGVYLSNEKQPAELPGIRERWEFIEKVFSSHQVVKVVPHIKSFGCPYSCDFCIDSGIPYHQLDLKSIQDDFKFLLQKVKKPRISWFDPNFGVRLDEMLHAIEEVVPEGRIDFIAECSLSYLSETKVKELKRCGFIGIIPSVESWFDYGNKTGTGKFSGMEKMQQVAEQMNMIQSLIPYVHVNFLLGSDADKGPEPFELTRRFLDLAPGITPSFTLLTAFGRGTPTNAGYLKANRVLPFPFHFLHSAYTLNVRPQHYTWIEFYDHIIDLINYSFSAKVVMNRFRAIKKTVPRWVNLLMTLSVGGSGITKYHALIRHQLHTDNEFRKFFEQETTEIPDFFRRKIRKDLGAFWPWLPDGAICHDLHMPADMTNGLNKDSRLLPINTE
jgi:hypothetical protein